MIPGTKAGGKFTIETTIRDKNGNIKSHTIEEGVTEEAEDKAEGTPTAIAAFYIKVDKDISQRLRKEIDKVEEEGGRGIRRIK